MGELMMILVGDGMILQGISIFDGWCSETRVGIKGKNGA